MPISNRDAGSAAPRALRAVVLLAVLCGLGGALGGCASGGPAGNAFASAGSGATVAFESIDGPPPQVFDRMVNLLDSESKLRNVAIVSRDGTASYRVRSYLAAQVSRGRTTIAWVWDVYDRDQQRAIRLSGEEPAGKASMLRRDACHSAHGDRDEDHPDAEAEQEQSRQQIGEVVGVAGCVGQQQRSDRADGESAGRDVARRRVGEQVAGDLGAGGDGQRERQERETGLERGVPEDTLDEDRREEHGADEQRHAGALARPDDVDDLARQIVVARGLSRAECRRRAARHFSLEAMTDRYLETYRSLAGEPPA